MTTKTTTRETTTKEREYDVRREAGDDSVDDRDDRDDRDDGDDRGRRNTATTMHRGIARAISRGLSAYEREISPDNMGRLDSGNGILEGFLSGMSDFYDELSAVSQDMLDDMRENRRRRRRSRRDRDREDSRREARVEIDYERLAKLVAEELRRNPGTAKIVTP